MSSGIIVCGYVGHETTYAVRNHPRFGVVGVLASSAAMRPPGIGGDAYHVGRVLKEMGTPTYIFSIVGNDERGSQVCATMKEQGMDCAHVRRKEGVSTPTLINFNDVEGAIMSYISDIPESQETSSPLSGFNKKNVNCAVVTTMSSHLLEDAFASLSKLAIPVIWYPQGYVFDIHPRSLLKYIHASRYLILNMYEEAHFKNILGLASIDLLLKEGVDVIVTVEYKKGSYTYNVYTDIALPTHHFASLVGYDAHEYRNVILGFVAGFSNAAYHKESLELMIKIGIACSEEYIISLKEPSHIFDYRKLKEKIIE